MRSAILPVTGETGHLSAGRKKPGCVQCAVFLPGIICNLDFVLILWVKLKHYVDYLCLKHLSEREVHQDKVVWLLVCWDVSEAAGHRNNHRSR